MLALHSTIIKVKEDLASGNAASLTLDQIDAIFSGTTAAYAELKINNPKNRAQVFQYIKDSTIPTIIDFTDKYHLFHIAVQRKNVDAFSFFARYGAKLAEPDKNGQTVIELMITVPEFNYLRNIRINETDRLKAIGILTEKALEYAQTDSDTESAKISEIISRMNELHEESILCSGEFMPLHCQNYFRCSDVHMDESLRKAIYNGMRKIIIACSDHKNSTIASILNTDVQSTFEIDSYPYCKSDESIFSDTCTELKRIPHLLSKSNLVLHESVSRATILISRIFRNDSGLGESFKNTLPLARSYFDDRERIALEQRLQIIVYDTISMNYEETTRFLLKNISKEKINQPRRDLKETKFNRVIHCENHNPDSEYNIIQHFIATSHRHYDDTRNPVLMLKILSNAGADFRCLTSRRETLLHLAVIHNPTILNVLTSIMVSSGVVVQEMLVSKDVDGNTVSELAAEKLNVKIYGGGTVQDFLTKHETLLPQQAAAMPVEESSSINIPPVQTGALLPESEETASNENIYQQTCHALYTLTQASISDDAALQQYKIIGTAIPKLSADQINQPIEAFAGDNLLQVCLAHQDLHPLIVALLERKPNLECSAKNGTLLHIAAKARFKGFAAILQKLQNLLPPHELVEFLNKTDSNGKTALVILTELEADSGLIQTVKDLIEGRRPRLSLPAHSRTVVPPSHRIPEALRPAESLEPGDGSHVTHTEKQTPGRQLLSIPVFFCVGFLLALAHGFNFLFDIQDSWLFRSLEQAWHNYVLAPWGLELERRENDADDSAPSLEGAKISLTAPGENVPTPQQLPGNLMLGQDMGSTNGGPQEKIKDDFKRRTME